MTKIAIISDIHGNREALKTTLEDIKRRKCDKIMCLGDIIAKGAFSNECVELIRKNCDVVLRGNCDEYFTSKHDLTQVVQYDIDKEIEESVDRISQGTIYELKHGMYRDLDKVNNILTKQGIDIKKI